MGDPRWQRRQTIGWALVCVLKVFALSASVVGGAAPMIVTALGVLTAVGFGMLAWHAYFWRTTTRMRRTHHVDLNGRTSRHRVDR